MMFSCPVVHSNCFSTTNFSWSLASSKGSEVSDNVWLDKESAFVVLQYRAAISHNRVVEPAFCPLQFTLRCLYQVITSCLNDFYIALWGVICCLGAYIICMIFHEVLKLELSFLGFH